MKMRNSAVAVAACLILTAPVLGAGFAGDSGIATDLEPVRHQLASERTGTAQHDSLQEPNTGIACPPGPIMEEKTDLFSGNGPRAGTGVGTYHGAIEGQPGSTRL